MSSENPVTDNKALPITHSTYEMESCIFKNSDGDTIDIRPIVKFVRIYENIFSPAITCELGVRDDLNFLEFFKVRGNESILMEFSIHSYEDQPRIVSLQLFVKEYRDYKRAGEETQTQAYIIVAMPPHAYMAPLLKISRAYTTQKNSNSYITDILIKDLGVPETQIFEPTSEGQSLCTTYHKKVITETNPLKEAIKLTETSLDANQTPYLLYQILPNSFRGTDFPANIMLTPLSYLTDRSVNPIYKTFTVKTNHDTDRSMPRQNYFERSTSIEKISSNINLSPLSMSKKGVFARTVRSYNIGNKSENVVSFSQDSLDSDFMTSKIIDQNNSYLPTLISQFRSNYATETSDMMKKLGNYTESVVNHTYSSKYTFMDADGEEGYVSATLGIKPIRDAYINAYEACTHSFQVMGDTLLNPGRTIKLIFPKALSPNHNDVKDDPFDRLLSGDYMIFSSIHMFMDGKYTTDLVVKTDGLGQGIQGSQSLSEGSVFEILNENAIKFKK